MAIRRIKGLKWAQQCARPKCIPKGRARGACAQGLRYERSLAKRLPLAEHGQWFEYEDSNGLGYCQPDLIVKLPDRTWGVIEVKYTWVPEAHLQIEALYLPVIEAARQEPVCGVVACKRLVEGMRGTTVTGDLWHAFQLSAEGRRPVFHWLGKASVMSLRLLDLEAA